MTLPAPRSRPSSMGAGALTTGRNGAITPMTAAMQKLDAKLAAIDAVTARSVSAVRVPTPLMTGPKLHKPYHAIPTMVTHSDGGGGFSSSMTVVELNELKKLKSSHRSSNISLNSISSWGTEVPFGDAGSALDESMNSKWR